MQHLDSGSTHVILLGDEIHNTSSHLVDIHRKLSKRMRGHVTDNRKWKGFSRQFQFIKTLSRTDCANCSDIGFSSKYIIMSNVSDAITILDAKTNEMLQQHFMEGGVAGLLVHDRGNHQNNREELFICSNNSKSNGKIK